MPGKKYRIQAHRDYDMLDNAPSKRDIVRDEDIPFIEDVATASDVPFRNLSHKWYDQEFKLKRGGNQKKLEGWERKCIEAYVMGWLTYHDMVVNGKPQFDHDIFLDWADDNPNKKTTLTVYLDPNDI